MFPAFAIAAVVFGFVLRRNPDLLAQVTDALDNALPGFVKTPDNPNGLIASRGADPVPPHHQPGILAVVTLVLSALGWIRVLSRRDPRGPGRRRLPGNVLTDKLRDLGVFVLQGLAILVSAVLTSVLAASVRVDRRAHRAR